MRLLTDSANATGDEFEIGSWGNRQLSRLYTLFAWSASWDGATLTIQISPDNVNWFTVTGIAITTNSCVNLEFRARYVRAVVAGGGGAESVNAFLC